LYRFHQLAEFDQGKRSCRRRLAGHNERRRKPPPGSLASRYGHLRASFHEDNGRDGGFLVDFSHPRLSEAANDVWPIVRADDRSRGASSRRQDGLYTSHSGIATNVTQSYLDGSAGGSIFPDPKLPQGSSFGATSSGCALSLLSSEPRGASASTNRGPTISGNNYDGSPLAQAGASASYTKSAWSFHETSSSMLEIQRPANFGQATERGDGDSSGELSLAPQGNKECVDSGYGRIYTPGNPMN
ncbi:hypothetical protein Taro_006747, partial [Colocasia esculenta]|nr:hypothetical protein [Colocasia esculenta]